MRDGGALRSAVEADLPALAALSGLSRRTAMPWLPVLHTPEGDLRFMQNRVFPKSTVTIATSHGAVAGFCATTPGWIDHLYLHPDYWRRGLGRTLVAQAQAQQPTLTLWTFQGNAAARAFYAAQGFAEVELTDGAGNEERTPDVRLEWRAAEAGA